MIKKYTEFLNESVDMNTSLESILSKADTEADNYTAEIYKQQAEMLQKKYPDLIKDWQFVSSGGNLIGKDAKDKAWSRKNSTSKAYYSFSSSSQGKSGLVFFINFKMPKITEEIQGMRVQLGDQPVYRLSVVFAFNTTGNKAYTHLCDFEKNKASGSVYYTFPDSTRFEMMIPKLKSAYKDLNTRSVHQDHYYDWVSSQKDHPLRGSAHGSKFNL